MYDVFDICNFLFYYKYIIDIVSVFVFNGLFYVIIRQGIEIYIVRIYVVVFDWIRKYVVEDV